jgi:hypothetical protein
MRNVHPPVASIDQLTDFLRVWHHIPSSLESVDIPLAVPLPLQILYQNFGLLASRDERFDRDFETGYAAVGIFAVQDMLVPVSRLEENVFTAGPGRYEGQRFLTFIHEAQWCWYLHVPLQSGSDPPVFMTETSYVNQARPRQPEPLVEIAPKLSEFLALHALRETVLGSETGWHRYRSFSEQDYIPALKPLLIGRSYVDHRWRYDFYIDDTERLLIMAEVNTDITYIAARGLGLANISGDHADFDAGWRC